MAKCSPIRRKHRKVCLGDMDSVVKIQNRAIAAPAFGLVDFGEAFSDADPAAWALIETVSGEAVFDSTNTERSVTHHLYINFDVTVTEESWVELDDGAKLDVVTVEDLEERHEFMLLRCSNRGTSEAALA